MGYNKLLNKTSLGFSETALENEKVTTFDFLKPNFDT